MADNDYYVYEHYRLDNNDTFYIGKGHNKRVNNPKRNSHHDRVAKKYGMGVRIIKDGLSEEDAYELEKYTIASYVFNLGYGIDIDGYRNESEHQLTNCTFGGDGSFGLVHTDEWCEQHSIDMTGENNPMYGVNLWESFSDEKAAEIKAKISKSSSGKNNPMYGVSPEERMSPEVYKEWLYKVTERGKSLTGENNPNYGNDTLKKKLQQNPELKMEYYSRPGTQNGRCRRVSVLDNNRTVLHTFNYMGECALWLKEELNILSKIDGIRSHIGFSIKNNKKYHGFYFQYEE